MQLRLGLGCLAVYCLLSPLGSFAQSTIEALPGASDEIALGSSDVSADPQNSNNAAPVASGNVAPVVTAYVFPSKGKLANYWLRNSFGPRGYIGPSLRASWNTWVNTSPEEWEQGASGWSRRFGVAFLENTVNQSALVLLSGLTRQDPIYYNCSCTGFWPRSRHAAKLTFVGRNHSGNGVFSPAKVISPFFGPMLTRNTLYPSRFDSGDALASGATYLIGRIGWNMVREFFEKGEKW